ncbi:MAG TPA: hypothetical protein ENH60_01495 [Pricia sp.]|nr:hypothetical protein [Pricia sp.]
MATERPFIKLENHLIPLHRITEIGFLPKTKIYTVKDTVYYEKHVAKNTARELGVEVITETVPVILIYYKNVQDVDDFARQYGAKAEYLWNVLYNDHSIPE